MRARVRHASVNGFDAVTLENAKLRTTVIPALGGRVWELVDLLRDRQWIWHRDEVLLNEVDVGSTYDDVWAGGWEEVFPNDAPGPFEGRDLPDHGEWWAVPWVIDEATDGDQAILRLSTTLAVRKVACVKEFRLANDDATISVSYRIENQGTEGFHFLFKQHLPVALHSGCELVLPGGRVTAVDPGFGSLLPGVGPFEWPAAGGVAGETGLCRVLLPSSAAREFVYVDSLPAGWCGVDDLSRAASLRMEFDLACMPYIWLFLTYGGWRGCYTAVLEPCTNMPKSLPEAVRAGRSGFLPPGGVFHTRVAVSLLSLQRKY